MLFNVSTLLQEPLGATRVFALEHERVSLPAHHYEAAVSGELRMLRTTRGILVRCSLAVTPSLQCGACLQPFVSMLSLELDEVFVAMRDPLTGEAVTAEDADDFRISDETHLDLSEAVRQYEEAALPIAPRCREDCAGLCTLCGQNLNEGACDCPVERSLRDQPALASLGERLRGTEEHDGRPEA